MCFIYILFFSVVLQMLKIFTPRIFSSHPIQGLVPLFLCFASILTYYLLQKKVFPSTLPSLRNVRTWLTWPSSMMPLSSTTWRCATSPSWSTPVSFHLFWKITLHLSIYFHCWIDKNLSTKLECFDLVCHFLTWHNFDFNVFSQTLVSSVLWSTLTNAIPSTLQ